MSYNKYDYFSTFIEKYIQIILEEGANRNIDEDDIRSMVYECFNKGV